MRHSCLACFMIGALALPGLSFAQSPAPAQSAPAPAPAPAPEKSPFTQAGMDFSFLLDAYVNGSFNSPDSGYNQIRNFDFRANTAHINMGKVTIDRAPAPVGFHLDVGFGQAFDWMHSTDRAPEAFKYFEQAYISLKPKAWKGVEVDFGEFTTAVGAEVIENNVNWNYSRSLLFSWAAPYYHFGLRTIIPVGKFTGGFQVVQGWNNIYDNNSGKTFGFSGAYAWKKVTWGNNYYVGPEKTKTNEGIRHLYDSTLLVNATDNLSFSGNFDYGREKNIGTGSSVWAGVAGSMRYSFKKNWAVATRAEIFTDRDGFSTGTAQTIKEVTITGEYKPSKWFIGRVEFRNDWSDKPFFEKGSGLSRSQPTILLGLVTYFGK